MSEYVLELRNITKRFPGVTALNRVQFQLKKGEIHALMGENGAGKSTLIKVITGVHMQDEGTVLVHGEEAFFQSTNDSAAKGIAAVYQHSTAYPHLSVTENIFIGHEKRNKLGLIDWKTMHKMAKELLVSLGSDIDPHTLMGNLSVAEQQIAEISKAVSANADIMIMDEPTAALSKRECEELYRITEQLRDEGKSILFISHRLEDMYRLADRVTVFRDAAYIGCRGTWWERCHPLSDHEPADQRSLRRRHHRHGVYRGNTPQTEQHPAKPDLFGQCRPDSLSRRPSQRPDRHVGYRWDHRDPAGGVTSCPNVLPGSRSFCLRTPFTFSPRSSPEVRRSRRRRGARGGEDVILARSRRFPVRHELLGGLPPLDTRGGVRLVHPVYDLPALRGGRISAPNPPAHRPCPPSKALKLHIG